MKINFLILSIPSLIALILVIWHLVKYRGRKTAFYFIFFGIVFGFLRAKTIYFIQVVQNHSFVPYQFNNKALRIGNDSLQVYVGWIVASYLAWCLAELLIKAYIKEIKKNDLENKIFPLIAVSFFVLASISYAIETTSSFMGWWSWNQFLTANFSGSLFVNVPWAGIVDWGTVSFEFLALFFLIKNAFVYKKWLYLLVVFLPIIHWSSHLYLETLNLKFGNYIITPSLFIHLLIPLLALVFFFIKSPNLDSDLILKNHNESKQQKLIWSAFFIIYGVCILADIFIGENWQYFLSLIPLFVIVLIALQKIRLSNFIKWSLPLLLVLLILPIEIFMKKRIVMAFFPLLFFSLVMIIETFLSHFKYSRLALKLFAVFLAFIILFMIITENHIKPPIPSKQKKIILITIDTLRADHVGVYGYDRPTTPNLDRFANESMVMENAYTPIPYTVPAHLSILTGLYPKSLKILDNTSVLSGASNAQTSLPELFKKKGYRTAAFISSNRLDNYAYKKDFDTFNFVPDQTNPSPEGQLERKAASTTTAANEWLKNNYNSDFFLWIHYYDPHPPYKSTCGTTFSKDLSPSLDKYTDAYITTHNLETKLEFNDQDAGYLKARYDEEIQCVDKSFDDLISEIKSEGIYQDATVIVVGDHGENFDHGDLFHGENLYQGAIKIPFIIKSPISGNQTKTGIPVSLIDILPTLSEQFNLLDKPLKIDGKDLSELVRGKTSRDLYFETKTISQKQHIKAILSKDKKMIENSDGKIELYDIPTDKDEIMNKYDNISKILFKFLRYKLDRFFPEGSENSLGDDALR